MSFASLNRLGLRPAVLVAIVMTPGFPRLLYAQGGPERFEVSGPASSYSADVLRCTPGATVSLRVRAINTSGRAVSLDQYIPSVAVTNHQVAQAGVAEGSGSRLTVRCLAEGRAGVEIRFASATKCFTVIAGRPADRRPSTCEGATVAIEEAAPEGRTVTGTPDESRATGTTPRQQRDTIRSPQVEPPPATLRNAPAPVDSCDAAGVASASAPFDVTRPTSEIYRRIARGTITATPISNARPDRTSEWRRLRLDLFSRNGERLLDGPGVYPFPIVWTSSDPSCLAIGTTTLGGGVESNVTAIRAQSRGRCASAMVKATIRRPDGDAEARCPVLAHREFSVVLSVP